MYSVSSTPAPAAAVAAFLLTEVSPLERDVLLGLSLVHIDDAIPVTSDGRLTREAFGRDAQLTIIKSRTNGARVLEERKTALCDENGAPKCCVYNNLVYIGLARRVNARCGWELTSLGEIATDIM